jgi:capsular polysaccharide transport system permease protein
LNERGLTATDKEGSAAEAPPIRVEAQDHPVLDQKTLEFQFRLPPPMDGEEIVEPRVGFWRRHRLFIVTVVLPMAVAAGFLLFLLAPRYSSTASFYVRSIDENPGQDILSTLDTMTATINNGDFYVVNTYLTSRDIVDQLAKDDNLRGILSRPQGDFVFRYPTFWLPDNKEFLYRRFQWMTTAKFDEATRISTIEVNAFTPGDAQALAEAMLRYAEALVNRMNERFYQSQVATAERFMTEAQKKVDAIEAELKAFRNVSGSVDPTVVAQSELTVIQTLSTQLDQIEASIAQQRKLAPTSVSLSGLRAQAQSYRDEIARRSLEIAGTDGSEAAKLQTYDQLQVRRQLALQELADALTQREMARQEALRQHLYIQLISKPNLARDWPTYPKTTFDLLALLAISLVVFLGLRQMRDIALEHHPFGAEHHP